MRVAFFSPLPPARSGIADYSAALIDSLEPLVELTVFDGGSRPWDASLFDIALYQIGNNECHGFAYEAALRHPGVVALHECNLHHLIAGLTIRRGAWDAYLDECEYNGGAPARAFAVKVRSLETGPDYEGLKMTRRLLETARGVVVHSHFMERELRAAGYTGPVAVIPHGAWIPQADRNGYRQRLGLSETTPLAGIFGYLKPYKRIAESLRAFRRLIRVTPDARMILAGEPHPDLPLGPLIESLGLSGAVRVLGFTDPGEFEGYLGACDVVLNLRYPTVGESSGTLQRALGLGKAALVSDVGSFHELPDDVCVKVPIVAGEEDAIFEYLNLLVSRPELAAALGERARAYAERECAWPVAARRYAEFLESVASGRNEKSLRKQSGTEDQSLSQGFVFEPDRPQETMACPTDRPQETMACATSGEAVSYLRTWAASGASRSYLETHQTRLAKTLEMIPPGGPSDRVLEMGAYLQITPALKTRLGYGEVRGCYYGTPGRTDRRVAESTTGERFTCEIDHFDAERDPFPYPDAYFSTVLCCELIEHLSEDPMRLMSEANRTLRDGGHLLLTTPNAASLRALTAVLHGFHPGFYPAYIRPARPDEEVEARHNREYTPREVQQLLAASGFSVVRLETGEFRDLPHPEYGWVTHLLERYRLETDLRGDGIFALGRKTGPVRDRYPKWLYS